MYRPKRTSPTSQKDLPSGDGFYSDMTERTDPPPSKMHQDCLPVGSVPQSVTPATATAPAPLPWIHLAIVKPQIQVTLEKIDDLESDIGERETEKDAHGMLVDKSICQGTVESKNFSC